MPTVKIEGVGTVRIDAKPGTPQFDQAIDEIKTAHAPQQAAFDPNNPMAGVPASSIPVGGFGGGMATMQTAKDVQSAAVSGEKALRTGAGAAAGVATAGALAPFAAGATLGAGLAAGAATGLASGTARHAVEAVLGGENKSLKDVSRDLAIDTVLGTGNEAAIRTGSYLMKLGGEKVILPLVARAAARTDQGIRTLQDFGVKMMNGIRTVADDAGSPTIRYQDMLGKFNDAMSVIRTGHSDTFAKRVPDLLEKLHASGGDLASMVEIKGSLSQFAYKGSGLNFEEAAALKNLTQDMDQAIALKMKQIGGADGKALYTGLKENWEQVKKYSAGLDFTAEAVKRLTVRGALAIAGGGAGYQAGKKYGTVGGIIGATAGAAAADMLAKQVSPMILERMLADKAAGPMVKLAMTKAMQGELKEAEGLFRRAAGQTGIQEILEPLVAGAVQRATAPTQPTAQEAQQ